MSERTDNEISVKKKQQQIGQGWKSMRLVIYKRVTSYENLQTDTINK